MEEYKMGFLNLKEFKEELSQAVNELVDEDNAASKTSSNTAADEMAAGIENEDVVIPDVGSLNDDEIINTLDTEDLDLETTAAETVDYESNIDMATLNQMFNEDKEKNRNKNKSKKKDKKSEETFVADKKAEPKLEKMVEEPVAEPVNEEIAKEDNIMSRLDEEVKNIEEVKDEMKSSKSDTGIASDEVAEITKGMCIEGNVTSDGSINVNGKVKGDIKCNGKLVISGTVIGVSNASEIYTNDAKVNGDIMSDGSIKVGSSSIIIGNVFGTSAVIGGAIKGDLDVKGPVIVDGTAVIQGNIKSRSVQINNGAVIEGVISQCYADVDYNALFDKTFTE